MAISGEVIDAWSGLTKRDRELDQWAEQVRQRVDEELRLPLFREETKMN